MLPLTNARNLKLCFSSISTRGLEKLIPQSAFSSSSLSLPPFMKTRRHFFRMCGSPIRTVKASELDYLEVKTKKQLRVTDETAASLDRREAKVKQVTLAPAVLEPLRVDSGGTAIGYYGPPKAEDYAYPPHQADKSGPLLLDGARQAKIPLFMSDAFERKQQHKAALGEATPEPKPTATTAPVTAVPAIKHLKQREVRMTELSLQKVIGEGAFGKVYKALYKGRSVAVKVLIKQNLSDDVVSEFETEVKIMSLLNHPNICRLLGACLQPYNRALVIELAEKGSLWSVLRSGRSALTDAMRVKFMLDTARGMSYLHQFRRPILHRDLKSPNMLVQDDFSIKLSDFGLARVKTQIQTMTGNCGTVQWMAPEVLGNRKYTEKADVFSFGIVMWEIFTGRCPHDGLSQIQVALSVLNHDLRPTIPRNCPRAIARLMRTCWIREPNLRPSFAELARAIAKHSDTIQKQRITEI